MLREADKGAGGARGERKKTGRLRVGSLWVGFKGGKKKASSGEDSLRQEILFIGKKKKK